MSSLLVFFGFRNTVLLDVNIYKLSFI